MAPSLPFKYSDEALGALKVVGKNGSSLADASKALSKMKAVSAQAVTLSAKQSASLAVSTRQTVMNAMKNALTSAGKTATDTIKSASKVTPTQYVKGAKYAAGATVLVGGIVYVALPYAEFDKKNGAILTITGIEKIVTPENNLIKVTYTPGIELYKADTLTVSNNTSVPSINDTLTINNIISETVVELIVNDNRFTTISINGTLTLNTTYDNQLALQNDKIEDSINDGANNLMGTLWDTFLSFAETTGLDKYFGYIKNFFIGLGIFILLMIVYKIYSIFKPSSKFGRRKYKIKKFGIRRR